MSLQHQLDTYRDGYCFITFCKVCSAEGERLSFECVPLVETDNLEDRLKNIWKDVDKMRLKD